MTTKSDGNVNDPWTDLNVDDAELQNLLDKPLDGLDNSRLRDGEQHKGFDSNVGDSWIYPNNLPCRSYQLSIVQAALYRNTLVVLPTGLGKTFIAAVVMYNLYRWYPKGKVLFMAPTRPLVNQQIEACQQIVPFPRKDTVELTGKLQKSKRIELWKTKRVFFATPQVVQSDILGGQVQGDETGGEYSFDDSTSANKFEFPFEAIKLIVIDEAHKAKGRYAYTEVLQAIASKTKYFRVLALSATPGRTMEDVAEVCRNLLISHIEVRWDTSVDVIPYVHKRSMETVVIELGERIKEIREELLEIIDPYLRQLIEAGVLSGSLANINRNFLIFEQKRYQERCLHNGRHAQHSAINSNFAICISLYHSLELLERHGLRVFLNNFEEDIEGRGKFVLQMDRRLKRMVDDLREEMGPNPFDISAGPMTNGQIADMPKDLNFGHPKFEKARECLIKHFQANEKSRAIVFCEYRESVLLIYRMLLQHVPLLRPRCFVGQGGTGALRALTQKQQIQIMADFRSGKSNILIATSIGEEGIDVGEVDLIVCFDMSTSNPTRFVQRIGRTGRKKNGNVVILVTEGREQQILREVLSNKDQTNKKILRSTVVQQALYKQCPRLVPTEFKPKCIQTYVKPYDDDTEEEEDTKSKKAVAKKSGAKVKTLEKGHQDLRKFFTKKPPKQLDPEDEEYFEIDRNMSQALPGVHTQQKMEQSFDYMKNLFKDLQSPGPSQVQTRRDKLQPSASKDISKLNIDSIDLCDDEPIELPRESPPPKRKKLEKLQGSVKDFYKSQELHEDSTLDGTVVSTKEIGDSQRLKDLKKFIETTFTTSDVLKRAKINDLGYHLKSKELSEDMKYILLTGHIDYVRENLEQIKVLNALVDVDTSSETAEEKSIKEIHEIICKLFGGLEEVEKFLEAKEVENFRQQTATEFSTDESDSEEEALFKQKLDLIFGDLGPPLKPQETYEWVQEEFKKTAEYQEMLKVEEKTKSQTPIQESMVYNTFDDNVDGEQNEDMSFTESKYCSQWQEFNKPDIAFKSTPVQGPSKTFLNLGTVSKKTSLLTKLEEVDEDEETEDDKQKELNASNSSMNTSSKFLQSLLMCETALKTFHLQQLQAKENDKPNANLNSNYLEEDTSSRDTDSTTGSLIMKDSEYAIKSRPEDMLSSTAKEESLKAFAEQMDDEEEDEMFLAALDAEMRFTQTKSREEDTKNKTVSLTDVDKTPNNLEANKISTNPKVNENDTTNSLTDVDKTPDNLNLTAEIPALSLDKRNSSVKLTPPSLNSTPDIMESSFQQALPKVAVSSTLPTPPEISIQHELDVDMEAFMEPFPEEQQLLKTSCSTKTQPSLPSRRESLKENLSKDCSSRHSPDLFAEEQNSKSPNLLHAKATTNKTSLASKLSAKLNVHRCQSSLNPTTSSSAFFKSPHKQLQPSKSSIPLTSPSSRLSTDKLKTDKSPSIFDMYLNNGRGRTKLPKTLVNSYPSVLGTSRTTSESKGSPIIPATQNESLMVVRKRGAPKRKIFDSDSEENDDGADSKNLTVINVDDNGSDTDFEEVAATQGADESSILQQRRKRRRFNSFIEQEAAVSGSDSEDEAEHTMGCYMLDSIVVPSDDEDVDQASTSHMQAMYLQSLKSPQTRRGAFKIPAARVYNDQTHIFSQSLLPEEVCSQYMPDSFVVDEDDSFINNNANITEVSMCPLERAEKILKERRKAKKKLNNQQRSNEATATTAKTKRKKKIQVFDDSSDEQFD